ncbi:putative flagellar basal body component [Blattamonas nauphoetae]|uniref:B9 domain-containing protein 1 n=1 Tax=Blattamonas nauphoetae TaxID=2049346 RepID=A0ABQ9YET2_9EUKA|nr:putative flagellar basal body component [Blattamonas nauphoetae]
MSVLSAQTRSSYSSTGMGSFQVVVTGTLESVTVSGFDNVHAHYSFKKGSKWQYTGGIEEGNTQMGSKAFSGPNRNTIVWNFPIEIQFSSVSPSGWPQLIVTVYGLNWLGRDIIVGTGCVHLPVGPGSHELAIPLFKPKDSSGFHSLHSLITGTLPEFRDPHFASLTTQRSVVRTQSTGFVRVVLNVTFRNMNALEYSYSGKEYSL